MIFGVKHTSFIGLKSIAKLQITEVAAIFTSMSGCRMSTNSGGATPASIKLVLKMLTDRVSIRTAHTQRARLVLDCHRLQYSLGWMFLTAAGPKMV